MEKEDILQKYFRVYAEIDLDAIEHNLHEMKNRLPEGVEVAAVLKTDGYGHGAVPIARVLKNQVRAYALATIDEAMNLRRHGIENELFILGFLPETRIDDAIKNEIMPAVFTYALACKINERAQALGVVAPIQIKVDTGMGRIGFLTEEASVQEVKKIAALPHLCIKGIFTHFASSDSADKSMTAKQYEKFSWFYHRLEEEGISIPVKHCDNSAGIIDIPEDAMDMVRAGIALYGMYPSEEVDQKKVQLIPALSLKSHIIYIKELEAGCGISYGSTYVTIRRTRIATIPVGYGDGYQRNLSNRGYVLIRGKKAPILGRVCMDQFMVDVTDIDGVAEGDCVTLIGRDLEESISVEELAELCGTFHYEFVCDLGKRIPRVYYHRGKIVCTKDYFEDDYDCRE